MHCNPIIKLIFDEPWNASNKGLKWFTTLNLDKCRENNKVILKGINIKNSTRHMMNSMVNLNPNNETLASIDHTVSLYHHSDIQLW